MNLKSNLYFKNKESNLLVLLFVFSLIIRIPVIFIFGDTELENEWGILVNNLTEHGKLSMKNFGNVFVPNVFMPPLYAFYLFIFKFFHLSKDLYIHVVLISQCLISSFAVIIFYLINKMFFSKKLSLLGALLFSLLPIHVYACAQISSIILQTFLTILFFYFYLKLIEKNNLYYIFLLSISAGLLILLRGEFIALFILSILYLIIINKLNLKKSFLIILLTLIVISPYLTRNIFILDSVTITKSIGYNLWKGNNTKADVEGFSSYSYYSSLKEKIDGVPKDKYYEINLDKVFLHAGISSILENPKGFFILYCKKFLSFVIININSTYPNYYNPLHYLPVLVLSLLSIAGIVMSDRNSYQMNFLILFFLSNVAIVSFFFILPRYKLGIIPLQIIFSNILLEYIVNKFFTKK